MTAPHYVRPAHHPLPMGHRLDGIGHDAARTPSPRKSTAPAGLFAPAPEVVKKPKPPKKRYQATIATGRPSRAKSGPRQIAKEAVCGTVSGYHRHLRVTKTTPCAECKAAKAEYQRTNYSPPSTPKKPPACGTTAAYRAHRTKGEPTCEPCREANRVYQRAAWERRIAAGWKRKSRAVTEKDAA